MDKKIMLRFKHLTGYMDELEVCGLEIEMDNKILYDCSIWSEEEGVLDSGLYFVMPVDNELESFILEEYISEKSFQELCSFCKEHTRDVLVCEATSTADFESSLLLKGVEI